MKKKRLIFLLFVLFSITSICCFISIILFRVFTPFVEIQGPSMLPNLVGGEIWVLNRYDTIERGDIVVFKKPGREDLIKRVIGIPGDEILLQDGEVYLNDNLLEESYLEDSITTSEGDSIKEDIEYKVPDNSYFLMGDNRSNSLDSRFLAVGFVKREWIEGELLVKLWPISN